MTLKPDIVIIGSGMGGATVAAGLKGSGARVVVLERGERIRDTAETRDARAIFQRGHYRPKEVWHDPKGGTINPGNYYYVGGNTKLYGAVLMRYRAEDFGEMAHDGGVSPAWPFAYAELEPWYCKAERLFQVRGSLGEDPTEPYHSEPYPHPPVPDEPAIALVRARMARVRLKPASLPLGVDVERWLARAKTTWDAFPDTFTGKMDAETCALARALEDPNITLETGALVTRLEADGKGRITRVIYQQGGEERSLAPALTVLSAGAIQSAALLLASASGRFPHGLGNGADQVGRYFMNHNSSAMLAIDPRARNDSVYQKTLSINDFYLGDGEGGAPLGNVQLLGRVTGPILKANLRLMPERLLSLVSRHAVDWYLMSEDLPKPESRVMLRDGRIVLDWQRSNMAGHLKLIARMRQLFRAAGYPIVLSRIFDGRTPSHQCGTVRMGSDPKHSVLDVWCRAWEHPNLYVVDAGFLPTSAAVNPSLTIAAQALRVADHIRRTELSA